MRPARALAMIVTALTLAWAGNVLAATSTMSFQGKLTASSGTPVADGNYAVTFSLWTDPLGGSLVWSEMQDVHVTGGEGLFTTHLGSVQPLGGPLVIHADLELYLQMSLPGEVLMPRLPISRAPYAFSSSSVHHVEAGVGAMEMRVGEDTTKILVTHLSFANTIDSDLNLDDDKGSYSLKCFGAGQPHPQSCNSNEVNEDGARTLVQADEDSDGDPETLYEAKADDKFAQVRGFQVDITGARKSFGSSADSAGVSSSLDMDSDDDGVAEFSGGGAVNDSSAQWSVSKPADVPGNHRDGWNVLCADGFTRTQLKDEFANGDIPTQDQMVDEDGSTFRAINTKGSGATVRVGMYANDDAVSECALDSDGDGNAESQANIGALINGNTVIGCLRDSDDDGDADVTVETVVNDDSALFQMTALSSVLPSTPTIAMAATPTGVHMEVGAATCDGSNWNNASDVNLKENFKDVDGASLLRKVSGLEITQWNYKGDTEHEHIGPTAQDFKETFGVGSDGKSISTIDPSGVALAAIQQLIKENEALRARIERLESAAVKQAR